MPKAKTKEALQQMIRRRDKEILKLKTYVKDLEHQVSHYRNQAWTSRSPYNG